MKFFSADHLSLPPHEPAVPVDPLPLQPAVPADHPPQAQSVRIQATAVFESCPNAQLCQDDVESLHKFLLSENHLRNNIVNISLVSTRSFSVGFTHILAMTLGVKTSWLWEPVQSYVSKHLGKSEWKLSNWTFHLFRKVRQIGISSTLNFPSFWNIVIIVSSFIYLCRFVR